MFTIYDLIGTVDVDKFADFIADFFNNMGSKEDLPLKCFHCPLKKECQNYEDDEKSCLEFLAEALK